MAEDRAGADHIRTYSLDEVAAAHLPRELKDPVRWLSMRLNRNELRGSRLGRYWRMSEADVQFMLERYSNAAELVEKPNPVSSPDFSIADGLSRRAARRRVRVIRRLEGGQDGHVR